jgi:hypothetical protein
VADHTLIDDYLDALRARLAWRRDVDDVLAEAADHLHSAAARLESEGATHEHAQRQALERFGDPEVLASAFATTSGRGAAVPTTFTRRAGTMAIVSGILWTTAGVGYLLSGWLEFRAGVWRGLPATILSLSGPALFTAAALTVTVMIALHERHGHFGWVGVAGIAVAGVGVVSTIMVWAFTIWGALLGLGTALVAAAMLSRDLAPRPVTIMFGSGLAAGAVLWATLRVREVGTPNAYGDYLLVDGTGVLTASVLVALGLFGLGAWLRSEEPADIAEPDNPLPA